MLALEIGDDPVHAGPTGGQDLAHAIEIRQPSIEATTGHQQLADEIHQAVEVLEVDPDRPLDGTAPRLALLANRRRRGRRRLARGRRVAGLSRCRQEVGQRPHQALRDLGEVDRVVGDDPEHRPDGLDGGEHAVHHRRRQAEPTSPDVDEQILEPVRDVTDRRASDDERGSLEGVHDPEEPADRFVGVAAASELTERRRHGVEMLGRLRSEIFDDLDIREELLELVPYRIGGRSAGAVDGDGRGADRVEAGL